MDKQSKQTTDPKATPVKKVTPTISSGKNEPEFADELTSSDIESAFKNPITGEERMY
ncbi:hypothetical protein [Paenibacillus pedocola]|uniref:hypothetical protein n=1 Tax=Paenibacillus pedocola TaxID=3242193 RepID=UPI00287732D8|nr:hypothetical protein [Paenibacillus typhae]